MTIKKYGVAVVIIMFVLNILASGSSINNIHTGQEPGSTIEIGASNFGIPSSTRGTILDLNNKADVTFFGVDKKDNYGDTLWTGDIDGDTIDELMVGTPWVESQAGNVSVIYTTFKSQFDLEQDAELIIKGKNSFSAQDHFAVCTGDIDGDGKEDIITGACFSDSGPGGLRYNAGEVWVIYGDTKSNLGNLIDLKTNADITIFGAELGDTAGYAVCTGDIDGDNKDDIIITSRYAPSGLGNGTIHVIYGDTRGNLGTQLDLLNAPLTISGIDGLDYAGSTLATGDINGDNRDDIIIGASRAEGPSNSRTEGGEVYIIYGDTKANLGSQKDLATDADLVIYGADDHDQFGHSLASGDINGDGRDDIIIGAEDSDGVANSRYNSGETYIFYGAGSLPGTWDLSTVAASVTIYGGDVGDGAGSAVAAAKINNDNFADILIGAGSGDGYNNQREDAGEAYVIYGDTTANLGTALDLASDSDIILYGVSPHDHTGSTVALGDLDGNGKSDIIIGAEDANSERGKVYLVYTDPPDIESPFLNLVNGHGTDGKLCYARYEPYVFNMDIIDEFGFDDLEAVSLTLELGEHGEIEYQWLAQTDSFQEVYDPNNYANLVSTSSDSSNDNNNTWTLDFKLDFNFKFPTEQLVSCKVNGKGFKGLESTNIYPNIFRIENDLEFSGGLVVQNSTNVILTENAWTRGGEKLSWSGLKVIYEDSDNIYPDDKYFNVTLTDGYNIEWKDTNSSGQVFYLESDEATISGSLSHVLTITEIPGGGTDKSDLPPFFTNIDANLPPPPNNVVVHADSYFDAQVRYDDDTRIFVTWTPEPDLESEIVGYYYSLTNNEFTNNGVWTTTPTGEFTGVTSGELEVYVWAMDNAGNIGGTASGTIFIDLQNVHFENAAPTSAVWQNTQTPICSIRVIDEGGAGIDFETIQYSISNNGVANYGNWSSAQILEIESENLVECSVEPYFSEGVNNYIKWRAKDQASSDYIESEDYLIKVDSKDVAFDLTAPQTKVWLVGNTVSCSISISDLGGSGVNATSIEYAVSTNNIYSYSDWRPANLVNNAESIVHTVQIDLLDGKENYIKWRAMDVAGNGNTVSIDYNIWINTAPQLVISSPEDHSIFLADTNIWFDASESTDSDQDQLRFYWVSDLAGAIGYSSQFKRMLLPGTHKVTVYVDDGYTHNVSRTLTITSYETDTDNDGTPDHLDDDDDNDDIPDWWEEQYGLNSKYGADAGKDLDKDGYSNIKEFQLNSSPLNSSDPPSNGTPIEDTTPQSEASEEVNIEWILALIVIIIILVILIIIIFIQVRKTQNRAQPEPEPSKAPEEHSQAPKSIPTAPAEDDVGAGAGPEAPRVPPLQLQDLNSNDQSPQP